MSTQSLSSTVRPPLPAAAINPADGRKDKALRPSAQIMAKLYWKMASSVDSPLNAPPSKPYGLVPRISIHLSAMKYLVVHGGVSVTPGNNRKVSPLGL